MESRKKFLKSVKRVVIKAGSGVLTAQNGLNSRVVNSLAGDICFLKDKGIEVVLVSSGAIASGMKKIGLTKMPESISHQQAAAAVGQSRLMMVYEKAFSRHNQKVAQILITRDDLNHRSRYLNSRNTIFTLMSWNITPIINENDTVVVDEIKCGDNDNLSAMVTSLTESDLLIILTDMDGLFDKDPRYNKDAKLVSVVDSVNREIRKFAGDIPGLLGTGGMASKIEAAKKTTLCGVPVIIANGRKQGILKSIFQGEDTGTLFRPQETTICGRKNWIAFAKSVKGWLVIDKGACNAIEKRGTSLLPSGVKEVKGKFSLGDSIALLDEKGKNLAVGLANYNSGDVKKIKGLKSSQVKDVLGYKHDDEIIHRDNLVLLT